LFFVKLVHEKIQLFIVTVAHTVLTNVNKYNIKLTLTKTINKYCRSAVH